MTSLGTQVGDALVGINHRQIGVGSVNGGDFGFDGGAGVRIQFVRIGKQVAEAVVDVDTCGSQFVAEFFKNRREEYFDGVSEDNRVGHFHHSGFHVQREQHAFCFRIFTCSARRASRAFLLITVASMISPTFRATGLRSSFCCLVCR